MNPFAYKAVIPLGAWLTFLLVWGCSGHGSHGHHADRHRNPDDIQEYLARLDRPERDTYQQPEKVLAALNLQAGMAIADLGAGSGYFTRRFIPAVGATGKVYSIDVEPQMLDYIKASLSGLESKRVEYMLAAPDHTRLAPNSVDLIFLCNVYHHLENRVDYFSKAKTELNPGGRIVVIDFYHDHRSGRIGFPRRHLVARETVIQEMAQAGLNLVNEHRFLERQYFLEFTTR